MAPVGIVSIFLFIYLLCIFIDSIQARKFIDNTILIRKAESIPYIINQYKRRADIRLLIIDTI
jgi:hypothetical protein